MSNAEYVRDLLLTCPYISASKLDAHIDFLGDKPLQYSIDGEPTAQVLKQYRGGDTLRRYSFILLSRMQTIDDATRAQNNRNYEQLSLWLEAQTRKRALPDMGDGAKANSIKAVGSVYLMETDTDTNSAAYQMQCELIYYQKARF